MSSQEVKVEDYPGVTPAERLANAMERCDYTQTELAEALHVHPKTVAGWVHGRHTPYKRYRPHLAELLGEDILDNTHGGDPPGPPSPPGPPARLTNEALLAQAQVAIAELTRRLANGETSTVPAPTQYTHPGHHRGRWDTHEAPGAGTSQ